MDAFSWSAMMYVQKSSFERWVRFWIEASRTRERIIEPQIGHYLSRISGAEECLCIIAVHSEVSYMSGRDRAIPKIPPLTLPIKIAVRTRIQNMEPASKIAYISCLRYPWQILRIIRSWPRHSHISSDEHRGMCDPVDVNCCWHTVDIMSWPDSVWCARDPRLPRSFWFRLLDKGHA